MNRPLFSCFLLSLFLPFISFCQEKWDLKKTIEYALAHNISVRQQDVQARMAALQYQQAKLSKYPTANLSANGGYSAGRNQNPVTFGLITQAYFFSNFSLQSGIEIFNWFSKKNNIAATALEARAAMATIEKLSDDIALNVAGAYLQALLAVEQVKINEVQLGQTKAQLDNTRKLVTAGSVPELNALQLEAQLATDSSGLISAQGNVAQAILLLKAYLSLDAGIPFEMATPDISSIPLDDMASLQPETVYQLAVKNLPQQRVNELRIQAAQKNIASAKGARYPTFSAFGSLGSSFNNKANKVTGSTPILAPLGKVTVGGSQYDVFPLQPFNNYSYSSIPYFGQINQNFRQSVGLSVSVPLANGGNLRTAYERSKLSLKNLELQSEGDNLSLKQDIYKAYTDAVTSMAKYNATVKTVTANQKAFDFATKRYNIGLLNTVDLLTTQNNLFSAKLQQLLAQFDYVFKMKVLEFYKGQGLKL